MKVNIASLKKIASNSLSDNSPEVVDDKFICVYVCVHVGCWGKWLEDRKN